jgi:hypothetical protein
VDDATRERLARALNEWRAAGGDQTDAESVAGLCAACFHGEWTRDRRFDWPVVSLEMGANPNDDLSIDLDSLAAGGTAAVWTGAAADRWTDVPDLLSALCAIAAAGVPRRAEGGPIIASFDRLADLLGDDAPDPDAILREREAERAKRMPCVPHVGGPATCINCGQSLDATRETGCPELAVVPVAPRTGAEAVVARLDEAAECERLRGRVAEVEARAERLANFIAAQNELDAAGGEWKPGDSSARCMRALNAREAARAALLPGDLAAGAAETETKP